MGKNYFSLGIWGEKGDDNPCARCHYFLSQCPASWARGPGKLPWSRERHFLPAGSKWDLAMCMPWAQWGIWAFSVCAFAWCKNSKSSNWVVSWALGELGRCTKYSAFCFIMNYSVYLEQREFSFLVFSMQFVPSLLVGVCWNLCFLLMRSSSLIRSKKNRVL